MKIKFILFGLIFACTPLTVKPAAEPPQEDQVPQAPLFQHVVYPTYHPAQGHPATIGTKYKVPCTHDEFINRYGSEKKVSVQFKKVDIQYLVEKIGNITDATQSAEIIRSILSNPLINNLTPCIVEITNSGDSIVKFDNNKFLIDYKDELSLDLHLDDTLKFQWANVYKFMLHGLTILGIFGIQALCIKLVSNWNNSENESDEAITSQQFIQSLEKALIDAGIQFTTLATGGFFVRNIAGKISLIKARTQVRSNLSQLETPSDYLIEEGGKRGSVKRVLFLVKSEACEQFAQKILTNNFMKYIVDSEATSVEMP